MAAVAAVLLVIAGAAWGYWQYAAHRKEQARVQSQLLAELEAQKQATEQAQRAAEDAKRDALLQAQKQAAEETLRRAQEERTRLEQDRKVIENEKRAANAAKKQTAALPTAPVALQTAVQYDGTYQGRVCTYFEKGPACRPVALIVRNGIAEGSWTNAATKASTTVKGTVDANGALELILGVTNPEGRVSQTSLAGRIEDRAITASGHYRNGIQVTGNWKRAK